MNIGQAAPSRRRFGQDDPPLRGDGRPDGPILTDLQTAPPPSLPTRRDTTFGRP